MYFIHIERRTFVFNICALIQDKQAKLIVRRRIKAGNFDECFDRVGVATLHMDKYAKKNTPVSYKLPIEKCNVQGGEVECIITVRFEGDPPVETFMSTDEYLYEKVYEKDKVNQRISVLLKQSAVDCEIHRKLHSREKPQISCMRFDTTATGEDLAFKPNIKTDDLDATYLRNMTRQKRRLQKLKIKDIVYFMDPDSKEIFDGQAFEDNQRLLRIGTKISDTQIKYWLG